MKWTRAMREDLARRTHLLISDPGFGEAMAKAFIELQERTRWHYPPEMPTEGRWWVTLDDGTTERAIYMYHNDWGFTGWVADSGGNEGEDISHRVRAWQPLPEPAPKKEGTP